MLILRVECNGNNNIDCKDSNMSDIPQQTVGSSKEEQNMQMLP